jgi:hypothetical protein
VTRVATIAAADLCRVVEAVLRPHSVPEHHADLVVRKGRASKNLFGKMGATVPLPDGCYCLVQIDPPPRTQRKRKQTR